MTITRARAERRCGACGFSRDEARTLALDPTCRKQIEQDAANATAAGVRSVPHFVFDNRFAINGGAVKTK
jgi:predicted DsbA family dithiol-disulfide isomerase